MDDARSYVARAIRRYWKGEIDPHEWHIMTLTLLKISNGKQDDLNNWTGICLKEMTVRVVSSIMAMCPLTVLDHSNAVEQITTICYQEAKHAL
jgi:hypothetical protein